MSGDGRNLVIMVVVSAMVHVGAITWVMPPQPEEPTVDELSILIAMTAPTFEEQQVLEDDPVVEQVTDDPEAPPADEAEPQDKQEEAEHEEDDPVKELFTDLAIDEFEPRQLVPEKPVPLTSLAAPESFEPNPRAESNYETLIAACLDRAKQYPKIALRRGVEGDCVLRIVLDRSGVVRLYRVEQSSGSLVLDQEVLEMVKRANPFPPAPVDLPGETHEYMIPIVFDIR